MASKILLIEDDPFLSEIYTTKLQEAGFDIEVFSDSVVGLAKAKETHPELILLDIVIPNMDGFEVLRAMKEDPEIKDIPVIILSNLGEEENVRKGLMLGAEAYFIKAHYTPTEVVTRVQEILQKMEKPS
jgi:DNA-binding response OmpR family regulator